VTCFEIDARLLERCESRRRAELDSALADLNAAGGAGVAAPPHVGESGLEVRLCMVSPRAVTFELRRPASPLPLARRHVHYVALRSAFRDYHRVIDRIVDTGFGADRRFAILDIAKKVVHDEAAETLQALLDGFLTLEQATARLLFTLVFLMRTGLPAHIVRYHREHADFDDVLDESPPDGG
jgi:uncharacterized protein (UPF0262 family)